MSELVIGLGILVLVSGAFLTMSWKHHLKAKKHEADLLNKRDV